ncbi:MAG: hypothetical protein Q9168_008320 [Polycauliona sp. 1 TL-2023]
MQVSSPYPGFEPFRISVGNDITIAGVRNGTGPPLLLLHGFPQTHLIWHKIAPHLLKHFTLIIPDLRGYGASSKPSTPDPDDHSLYSKSTMAADMVSLMQSLNFPKYYICAHDRGARVAHKLCVDYPSKVEKCIILDICPTKAMFTACKHPFGLLYWHWYFLSQRSPFPEDVIAAAPEVFARKTLGAAANVYDEMAHAAYAAQFGDRDTVHAMCEDYRAAAKEDIEEQTADEEAGRKIQCPLMVLWGKEGVVEKLFDARAEWRKVCAEGSLDEEGCFAVEGGHFIPEERPDDVLVLLQSLIIMTTRYNADDCDGFIRASDKLLEHIVPWIAQAAQYTGNSKPEGHAYFEEILRLAKDVQRNGAVVPGFLLGDLQTAIDLRKLTKEYDDRKVANTRKHASRKKAKKGENKDAACAKSTRNDRQRRVGVMERCLRILTDMYHEQNPGSTVATPSNPPDNTQTGDVEDGDVQDDDDQVEVDDSGDDEIAVDADGDDASSERRGSF